MFWTMVELAGIAGLLIFVRAGTGGLVMAFGEEDVFVDDFADFGSGAGVVGEVLVGATVFSGVVGVAGTDVWTAETSVE